MSNHPVKLFSNKRPKTKGFLRNCYSKNEFNENKLKHLHLQSHNRKKEEHNKIKLSL